MGEGLQDIIGLLAVAMIVAMVARRVRLPYTIGLVLVGALLAFSRRQFGPALTSELIFDLILPPLLFEAAISLRWRDLRRDLPAILTLSMLGTVIAMAVTAMGMRFLLDWPAPSALVFGALICATDPVAIIAMFKDNGLKGRLCLLVESESLFNDAAAAVLFVMATTWAQADHAPTATETAATLLRMVGGGVGVGLLAGGAAILFARGTSEHLIEVAWSTIAAFGSFLAADHFHVSGVLATVTAGLVMGNIGLFRHDEQNFLTPKGQESVIDFWEFAAFLANSLVFLLIGVNVATMPYETYGAVELASAIVIVLLGRALTVYPLSLAFRDSSRPITYARTTCAVVGRPARRARPGAGPVAAAVAAAARRNRGADFWRRRLLDRRAGPDHAAAAAAIGFFGGAIGGAIRGTGWRTAPIGASQIETAWSAAVGSKGK